MTDGYSTVDIEDIKVDTSGSWLAKEFFWKIHKKA
jgi:hypothetical protein